jgi:hypothetical protein
VKSPVAETSAMRNAGATRARVMTLAVPTRAMTVVMTGRPFGPLPAEPWLEVRV